VGTTSSKPPGPIIMLGQSKTGRSSQFIFITLFSSRCTGLLAPFNSSTNQAQERNHFLELNRHVLTFFHLIISVLFRVTYGAPVGMFSDHLHPFYWCLCKTLNTPKLKKPNTQNAQCNGKKRKTALNFECNFE
jgi:hypothetical protein